MKRKNVNRNLTTKAQLSPLAKVGGGAAHAFLAMSRNLFFSFLMSTCFSCFQMLLVIQKGTLRPLLEAAALTCPDHRDRSKKTKFTGFAM